MNTPSTSVTAGLGGFLAFFVLAVALWLLMRNMNARLRRMSYREEQRRAAAAGEGLSTPPDGDVRQAEPGTGAGGARAGGADQQSTTGQGPGGP